MVYEFMEKVEFTTDEEFTLAREIEKRFLTMAPGMRPLFVSVEVRSKNLKVVLGIRRSMELIQGEVLIRHACSQELQSNYCLDSYVFRGVSREEDDQSPEDPGKAPA